MRPEDESSKWSWISAVWDWYRVSGRSKMSGWRSLKDCYCRVDQISHNGLDGWRLRLAEASVLLEAGLVWLRIWLDHFRHRGQWSLVWQGVGFINIVQGHWKAFLVCLFAVMVLVAGCPLPAWAFVTSFGRAVVNVTTFPGKTHFRRFSSCPLDPVMGRFRDWRRGFVHFASQCWEMLLTSAGCAVQVQNSTMRESHFKNFTKIICWALTLLDNRTQVNSEQFFYTFIARQTSAGIASRKGCNTRQLSMQNLSHE